MAWKSNTFTTEHKDARTIKAVNYGWIGPMSHGCIKKNKGGNITAKK